MKNIAPDIVRKRLLIEANYLIGVKRETVQKYLLELVGVLSLKTYSDPIIHSPGGKGKEENQVFHCIFGQIKNLCPVFYTLAKISQPK